MSGFPVCTVCGRPVPITAKTGWLREVRGWEAPRRQGGTNALASRDLTGRFAHDLCIRDPRLAQGTLRV